MDKLDSSPAIISEDVGFRRDHATAIAPFNAHGRWYTFRLPSALVLIALAVLPLASLDLVACPFRWITGIPCPFCGLSRSVSCLLKFDLTQSLAFHPLGIIALVFLIACVVTNRLDYFPVLLQQRTGVNMRGKAGRLLLLLFAVVWLIRLLSTGLFL